AARQARRRVSRGRRVFRPRVELGERVVEVARRLVVAGQPLELLLLLRRALAAPIILGDLGAQAVFLLLERLDLLLGLAQGVPDPGHGRAGIRSLVRRRGARAPRLRYLALQHRDLALEADDVRVLLAVTQPELL